MLLVGDLDARELRQLQWCCSLSTRAVQAFKYVEQNISMGFGLLCVGCNPLSDRVCAAVQSALGGHTGLG
jgi:hypothetical protein